MLYVRRENAKKQGDPSNPAATTMMLGNLKALPVQRGTFCLSLSVVVTFLSISLFDVQLSDLITSSSASTRLRIGSVSVGDSVLEEPTGNNREEVLAELQDDDVSVTDFPAGFKPHPNVYSEVYLPRGKPLDEQAQREMANSWGSWTFLDPKGSTARPIVHRPNDDYFASYPSRDIPWSKFPSNAWQIDREYLSLFIPEAKSLVRRAMEAILAEYGHGASQEESKAFEERAQMFRVEITKSVTTSGPNNEAGGYMTELSWNSLVRRILHAVVTQDTFRIVTAGHSVAVGKGNHFQQGYTMQTQQILEPIFARLGVTMTANNLAMGGLGTSQTALGAKDLYGDDIDVLLYDSGMTESDAVLMDLFARQNIISGQKVPFLWVKQDYHKFFSSGIYSYLAEECNADIAVFGTGMKGIPSADTVEEASNLPWSAQFMRCDNEIADVCHDHKYMFQCWIDRGDVTPTTRQSSQPTGQVSSHPGFRVHKLQSRVLSFNILAAIEAALDLWSRQDGFTLADHQWHQQSHYDDIRSKMLTLNHTTPCHSSTTFPTRACDLPMHGRSEHTPRHNPHKTSIRSIASKANRLDEQVKPNIYDPPDVRNWVLDEGDVDIVNIIENGVDFQPLLGRKRRRRGRFAPDSWLRPLKSSYPNIRPVSKWTLSTYSAPDNCDGSYDSFCGRSATSSCLLEGTNHNRGGLEFTSRSGWLVLTLNRVEHGLIMVKIDDRITRWDPHAKELTFKQDLCRSVTARADSELASGAPPSTNATNTNPENPSSCEDFGFQFAISGNVTTWNCQDWRTNERSPKETVRLWTLLDDAQFADPQKPRDVELAIRTTGCHGLNTVLLLTHVYWA